MSNEVEREAYHKWKSGAEPYGFNGFTAFQAGAEWQRTQSQQAARIAELQLDADRYRWLEANSTYGIDYRQRPELTLPIYAPDHREGLDAAIDAAMRK